MSLWFCKHTHTHTRLQHRETRFVPLIGYRWRYLPNFCFFMWSHAARVTRKDALRWTRWIRSEERNADVISAVTHMYDSALHYSTYPNPDHWSCRMTDRGESFTKQQMRVTVTVLFTFTDIRWHSQLTQHCLPRYLEERKQSVFTAAFMNHCVTIKNLIEMMMISLVHSTYSTERVQRRLNELLTIFHWICHHNILFNSKGINTVWQTPRL